ncbi:hypothetical protein [Teredinibacter franksiae]|uniref:hypothetical protein n=1 Tax=Teredinibacter franksiae TaxID=2761453 RepID=UPI0016299985|nr:hypothetical protein [Teredinibacter franksiae]
MDRFLKSSGVAGKAEEGIFDVPDWGGIGGDVTLQGALSDSLRQTIGTLSAPKDTNDLIHSNQNFVALVLGDHPLSKDLLSPALNAVYEQQLQVYKTSNIPKYLRTRQYISASGLVLSPDHCVTTIRDSLRVGLFLRGGHNAIEQLRRENCSKPLHIVYPACGPFAPLLLPLLAYYKNHGVYSEKDISVTFIDIQEGAILALKTLVKTLDVQGYVRNIICNDACEYQTQEEIHLVILEAMQHGFSREGHLRLAKHYADRLSDNGIFLPKRISITASLSVPQREYVDQWKTMDDALHVEIQQERIALGCVLNVDLPFLRSMQAQELDEYTHLVECETLTIPPLEKDVSEQALLFHTRVNVFDDDWLGEYESGITHPLRDAQVCVNFTPRETLAGDLLVASGDRLTFYYCMNGLPGFLTTKTKDSLVTVGLSDSLGTCLEGCSEQ